MKDKQFHLDMFDSIDEYTRRYTIVRGFCDVISVLLTMIIGLYWVG